MSIQPHENEIFLTDLKTRQNLQQLNSDFFLIQIWVQTRPEFSIIRSRIRPIFSLLFFFTCERQIIEKPEQI